MLLAACLTLGLLAGLLAGLLGIGGGLVVVPALALLLPAAGWPPAGALHAAVATSLAGILITAPASAAAHARRGAVAWDACLTLAPGLLLGAWLAGWLGAGLDATLLRTAVVAYFLHAAWRLLRRPPPTPRRDAALPLPLLGPPVGAISALVGIGGGSLLVPALIRIGFPPVRAVGTAAACGVPIAIGGALGWSLGDGHGPLGWVWWPGALAVGLASALAAPLGARLAHLLPAARLARLLGLCLLLAAAWIALRGAAG